MELLERCGHMHVKSSGKLLALYLAIPLTTKKMSPSCGIAMSAQSRLRLPNSSSHHFAQTGPQPVWPVLKASSDDPEPSEGACFC